jgi:hypothetical protein
VISNRRLAIVAGLAGAALGVGVLAGLQLSDDPAGARVVQPGAPGQAGRTLSQAIMSPR